MHNWFTIKVSYEKIHENGTQGKVTEAYLIDALSFTEAEAHAIEELKPYITGDFTITDIRRARLSEAFFNGQSGLFYHAKIEFIGLDEKSQTEKRTPARMIIEASDFKEAYGSLAEGLKGTLCDYEIVSITKSPIMDVFLYDAAK